MERINSRRRAPRYLLFGLGLLATITSCRSQDVLETASEEIGLDLYTTPLGEPPAPDCIELALEHQDEVLDALENQPEQPDTLGASFPEDLEESIESTTSFPEVNELLQSAFPETTFRATKIPEIHRDDPEYFADESPSLEDYRNYALDYLRALSNIPTGLHNNSRPLSRAYFWPVRPVSLGGGYYFHTRGSYYTLSGDKSGTILTSPLYDRDGSFIVHEYGHHLFRTLEDLSPEDAQKLIVAMHCLQPSDLPYEEQSPDSSIIARIQEGQTDIVNANSPTNSPNAVHVTGYANHSHEEDIAEIVMKYFGPDAFVLILSSLSDPESRLDLKTAAVFGAFLEISPTALDGLVAVDDRTVMVSSD